MSQKVYLGIDTSCYTTSAALLAEDGSLLAEARQILSVKPGRCGLQQSEMVFQHTRNLPRLVEEVFSDKDCTLAAIGVSGYPRPLADSYMPAFLAGMSVARSLAAAYKVPLEVISRCRNCSSYWFLPPSSLSLSHLLGISLSMASGIRPAKMALRAYWVAVGRIAQ